MTSGRTCELSIVIPARHEEAFLGDVLKAFEAHFSKQYEDAYEIIVVVNGSSDATERIAVGFAAQHDAVRVMVEPDKIGKGAAVRMGLQAAEGRVIGFVDADGSTGPEAFQSLIDQLNGYQAVIASRRVDGACIHDRQSLGRRIGSRILNILVRGLFDLPFRDTQCGAKCFEGSFMREHVFPPWKEHSWAFDIEVLCLIRAAGGTVIERPTEWVHVQKIGKRNHLIWIEMAASLLRVVRDGRKRT